MRLFDTCMYLITLFEPVFLEPDKISKVLQDRPAIGHGEQDTE